MASAQVKIQDLKNGINACGVCTHELQLTAQQLQRDYMSAGSGWKDEQYKILDKSSRIAALQFCSQSPNLKAVKSGCRSLRLWLKNMRPDVGL